MKGSSKTMRLSGVALLAAAILFACALTIYGRQQQTAAHVAWEYKVSCSPKESGMNKLGAEGWELLSATGSGTVCLFYKRAK